MQISWLKAKGDNKSFKVQEKLGMDVFEIEDLENTDKEIEKLINNKYDTIFMSNELAGFSENIFKKYSKNNDVRIFIAPKNKIR